MAEIELRPGTDQNISFVMTTERLPGYEAIMGRWDEATHRAALAAPDKRYFIAEHGAEPVGFAILTGWASPDRVTLLKRIAVAIPGQGYGKLLLQKIIATVSTETDAYRLWLDVFPENTPARRAYEAAGFKAEGIARGNFFCRRAAGSDYYVHRSGRLGARNVRHESRASSHFWARHSEAITIE